jgi:uncharacterized protein
MSQKNQNIVPESDTLLKHVHEEIVVHESPKTKTEVTKKEEPISTSERFNGVIRTKSLIITTNVWSPASDDFVCESPNDMAEKESLLSNLKYLLVGVLFGIVFVKGEIVSWFRIQEMFQFTSFHMYGVIGTAVMVGAVSVFLIKKFNIKTLSGETVVFHAKKFNKGQVIGGLIFGFGWAMTGACPGPLFAQIGTGAAVVVVTLLSAIAGTWTYGLLRDKLPN